MARRWISLRPVLPVIWIGLIVGLSFMETPLEFQSPGITTELGLGIGRLVFIAGGDPREAWLHYGYTAGELVLLGMLVWYVAHSARCIRIA